MGSDTGGVKLTRDQADKKAREIYKEWIRKTDEAMAKANGTLPPGLDGDELFEPIDAEYRKKLQELAAMIDEDETVAPLLLVRGVWIEILFVRS